MDTGKEVLFALPLKVSKWWPLRPACPRLTFCFHNGQPEHHLFGPREGGHSETQDISTKRSTWLAREVKFRKVDNGTFQKIVFVFPVGHRVILLASGQLANFDYTPGHLSFEMPCSFADQVLPQLTC